MVVAPRGELDGSTRGQLERRILEIQGAQPVLLDLSDVPRCNAAGISAVQDINERLENQAWAFAVVADPHGPWPDALGEAVPTYPDRHAARSALHHSAL